MPKKGSGLERTRLWLTPYRDGKARPDGLVADYPARQDQAQTLRLAMMTAMLESIGYTMVFSDKEPAGVDAATESYEEFVPVKGRM